MSLQPTDCPIISICHALAPSVRRYISRTCHNVNHCYHNISWPVCLLIIFTNTAMAANRFNCSPVTQCSILPVTWIESLIWWSDMKLPCYLWIWWTPPKTNSLWFSSNSEYIKSASILIFCSTLCAVTIQRVQYKMSVLICSILFLCWCIIFRNRKLVGTVQRACPL